ncbi:MAG: hypothetical protein OK422_01450 [Thaumarchaeota archaeon]|nr:hypothetical protein [Nitrososphaerota archaeon]
MSSRGFLKGAFGGFVLALAVVGVLAGSTFAMGSFGSFTSAGAIVTSSTTNATSTSVVASAVTTTVTSTASSTAAPPAQVAGNSNSLTTTKALSSTTSCDVCHTMSQVQNSTAIQFGPTNSSPPGIDSLRTVLPLLLAFLVAIEAYILLSPREG